MIREYKPADLEELRSIHERFSTFPMPNPSHPLYVVKKTLEEDGRVIGAAFLRLTSEVTVILDTETQKRIRTKLLRDLILQGIFECQKIGLIDMHAFLTGPLADTFATVLEKSCGFNREPGIPVVLNL